MIDLIKIETILKAVQTLSFSGTARQLHRSQPSISHQIKTLEKELGVTLFERGGAGLRLTEAGRVLLPWARRLPGGELLLLLPSFAREGYAIGVARSASGQLPGPCLQDARPIYNDDGGHAMPFRDFDGNLWLACRHPNERPMFIKLSEDGQIHPG